MSENQNPYISSASYVPDDPWAAADAWKEEVERLTAQVAEARVWSVASSK